MNRVFLIVLGIFGVFIALAVFPAGAAVLTDFIDNIMPGLGFGNLLTAYIKVLPFIMLGLMLIFGAWTWSRHGEGD